MARLKGTVKEIRAQCANDIRKRDGDIQKLKRHLEGRRGVNGNAPVGVVVVAPGNGKGPNQQQVSQTTEGGASTDTTSPKYSLKEETTEFLTQLSQGLSDENDQLINLVKSTLASLRSLQGLPEPPRRDQGSANVIVSLPPSYDELTSDTSEVLDHLRSLLTNPSFVPLEEVEIRDDEILRLREGWERMAARWKDAVALMDSWRKRMVDTGGTVNLDDLTQGLKLDAGLLEDPSSTAVRSNVHTDEDDIDAGEEILSDPNIVWDQLQADESPKAPSFDATSSEHSFAESSPRKALRNTSGNARSFPTPRKVSLSTLNEEPTKDLTSSHQNDTTSKVWRTPQTNSPDAENHVSHPKLPPPAFTFSNISKTLVVFGTKVHVGRGATLVASKHSAET